MKSILFVLVFVFSIASFAQSTVFCTSGADCRLKAKNLGAKCKSPAIKRVGSAFQLICK